MVRKLQRIGEKSDSGAAGELARFFVDRLNKRESLFLRPSTIIAAFLHPAHRTELTPGNIQMAVHCAVHTTHSTHTHVHIACSVCMYVYVCVACISTHGSTPTMSCVSRERDRCVEKQCVCMCMCVHNKHIYIMLVCTHCVCVIIICIALCCR